MLEKSGVFCYNNSMKKEENYQKLSKEELIKLLLKKEENFDKLKEEYEAKFKAMQIKINEQLKEIEALKEKNILSRVRQFSPKSEHTKVHNEFNEAESNAKKRGRKQGSKNFDYEYLEKHVSKEIVLEPEEEICSTCGETLISAGEDITYKLDYEPSKLIVTKVISKKKACPKCNKIYQEIKDDVFPHSICTPSLASAIMTNKFLIGIPYYRQSEYFFDNGIKLSRQDLCNYQLRATDLLEPLYQRLKIHLLNTKSKCLCADETTLRVLDVNDKSKCYMWVYVTSYYDQPIYYYEFQKSRSKENPKAILKGFKGYLLTDAYQGYNDIENVKNCYCWAHARRKFYEIVKTLKPEQLKESKAYGMVQRIDKLFHIEEIMKKNKYLPHQIREERNNEKYLELLNDVKKYAENINAIPESALGKAKNYLLNHWKEFTTYLEDGHIEMTNNISERAIKPFVIARKNFLFNATTDGASSSAIIFSLQQTSRANLLDSEKYIAKVLELIKPNMSNDELDSLLPWNISKLYNLS